MQNSNEKSKCCNRCKGTNREIHTGGYVGIIRCENINCPCHKPSVEVSRCCGAEKGIKFSGIENKEQGGIYCRNCWLPFEPQSIPLEDKTMQKDENISEMPSLDRNEGEDKFKAGNFDAYLKSQTESEDKPFKNFTLGMFRQWFGEDSKDKVYKAEEVWEMLEQACPLIPTPNFTSESEDYKIGYCKTCIQSTNHLKGICQKCNLTPESTEMEEKKCVCGAKVAEPYSNVVFSNFPHCEHIENEWDKKLKKEFIEDGIFEFDLGGETEYKEVASEIADWWIKKQKEDKCSYKMGEDCKKCNPSPTSKLEPTEMEEWEKEFKRKFFVIDKDGDLMAISSPSCYPFYRNFIRNLLSSHSQKLVSELKEKIIEGIEEFRDDWDNCEHDWDLDVLIEKLNLK